jgi:tetratricopeptide (TPR) repeat protein
MDYNIGDMLLEFKMEVTVVDFTREKQENPILPARPPAELIPEGYRKKVIVMWLSFFGALFGLANLEGPLAFMLPLFLAVLAVDLILMIFGRIKDRPVWLYKDAQENFYRRRYDKALKKLNQIVEIRPDMEDKLFPAIMVCRNRTGDYQGACNYLHRLIDDGRINGESNPVLLLEVLGMLRRSGNWGKILDIARYIPEEGMYSDLYNYYKGVAYAEMGQAGKSKEHLERIEDEERFADIKIYKKKVNSSE